MSSIKGKLDILHNEIKKMGGINDLGWCEELLYPYYEHFNDENLRYRSGSLIAFWGLLLEWKNECGFPFYTGVEDYDCHHFDKYLVVFLKYSSEIKKQFPNIYFVIIESLMYLEKREDWGSEFPNIPIELFSKVREKLFKDVHLTNKVYKYEVHQNALKDAGMSY